MTFIQQYQAFVMETLKRCFQSNAHTIEQASDRLFQCPSLEVSTMFL